MAHYEMRGGNGLERRLEILAGRGGKGRVPLPVRVRYVGGQENDLVVLAHEVRNDRPKRFDYIIQKRFAVPQENDACEDYQTALTGDLTERGVDADTAEKITFTVIERMLNSQEQAMKVTGRGEQGYVGVHVLIYDDRVVAGVCHNGEGFDPIASLSPLLDGELRKRGHGMNICCGLANETVPYNGGTSWEMTFYLPRPEKAA